MNGSTRIRPDDQVVPIADLRRRLKRKTVRDAQYAVAAYASTEAHAQRVVVVDPTLEHTPTWVRDPNRPSRPCAVLVRDLDDLADGSLLTRLTSCASRWWGVRPLLHPSPVADRPLVRTITTT